MVFAPVLLRDAGAPSLATLEAQKSVVLALMRVPRPIWVAAEHEMSQRAKGEFDRLASTQPPSSEDRRGKSPFRAFFGKKK